jgi:hypothetical protein
MLILFPYRRINVNAKVATNGTTKIGSLQVNCKQPISEKQHFGHPSGAPDLIFPDPINANTNPKSS